MSADVPRGVSDDLAVRLKALRELYYSESQTKSSSDQDKDQNMDDTDAEPSEIPKRARSPTPPLPPTPPTPPKHAPISALTTTQDDLAERFARLFGPESLRDTPAVELDTDEEDLALDEATWERIERARKEGGVGELDEGESLVDILRHMGGEEDVGWVAGLGEAGKVDKDEEQEVRRLLAEARNILPKEEEGKREAEKDGDGDSDEDSVNVEGQTEEQEVKAILSMEFDRLKLEADRKRPRLDTNMGGTSDDDPDDDDGAGDLPIPPSPPKGSPPLHLSGFCPSPPKSFGYIPDLPASKSQEEEEEEQWCAICLADAEFACSGCDDLFCENCLWESHQGPDAGYEERMHKWTKIVDMKKKKKEEKRAVAIGA